MTLTSTSGAVDVQLTGAASATFNPPITITMPVPGKAVNEMVKIYTVTGTAYALLGVINVRPTGFVSFDVSSLSWKVGDPNPDPNVSTTTTATTAATTTVLPTTTTTTVLPTTIGTTTVPATTTTTVPALDGVALGIVNAAWGLGFGARRITISTSGLVPQIRRLAAEPVGFRLAVSLHGATNEVREQIMPVNRRWPLEELLPAIREFSERHGRMVTLEFILMEGVNDGPDQAARLGAIAGDLHAHVNLIPYNAVEGLPWRRPGAARQQSFLRVLQERGVSVTLRREKGHDIDAACGQLRLKVERERAAPAAS